MKKLAGVSLILALAALGGCATTPPEAPRDIDFSRYARVAIDQVHLAPELVTKMSHDEQITLAAHMRAAVEGALPAETLAPRAAPGVLRVEITVTGINTVNPATNAVTATLLLVPMDRGGITFEARYYDGLGETPIASSTHEQLGSPLNIKGSFSRYGHALEALEKWGENLAQSLPRA